MKYVLASLVAVGLIGGSYGLTCGVMNGEKHDNHHINKILKEEQDARQRTDSGENERPAIAPPAPRQPNAGMS